MYNIFFFAHFALLIRLTGHFFSRPNFNKNSPMKNNSFFFKSHVEYYATLHPRDVELHCHLEPYSSTVHLRYRITNYILHPSRRTVVHRYYTVSLSTRITIWCTTIIYSKMETRTFLHYACIPYSK